MSYLLPSTLNISTPKQILEILSSTFNWMFECNEHFSPEIGRYCPLYLSGCSSAMNISPQKLAFNSSIFNWIFKCNEHFYLKIGLYCHIYLDVQVQYAFLPQNRPYAVIFTWMFK